MFFFRADAVLAEFERQLAQHPQAMAQLGVAGPGPAALAAVDLARELDVVGLALGGEALGAQPRGPTQLAGALHLGQLRAALPGPGVRATRGAARHLAVGELVELAEVLVAHAVGRRLTEAADLLRGEPGPAVLATGDAARHLLVLHGAEQRGGQRRGAVVTAIVAAIVARRAAAIVAARAVVPRPITLRPITWRPVWPWTTRTIALRTPTLTARTLPAHGVARATLTRPIAAHLCLWPARTTVCATIRTNTRPA